MNRQTVVFALIFMIVAGFVTFLMWSEEQKVASIYCDYKKLGVDACDGQLVRLRGTDPEKSGTIKQHPIIADGQHYLEVRGYGQFMLVTEKTNTCDGSMEVIGVLDTHVGPCDTDSPGKSMYCGNAVAVQDILCK